MANRPTPLIESQRWKLRIAFAMVVLAGSLMWFDQQLSASIGVARHLPAFVGTVLGFATLGVSVVAVRCPECGVSLVWFALSKKTVTGWLAWLLDETTCPKCGYSVGVNGVDKQAL